MIYGSVCSGIEAATMAWHSLGWRPAFFSEIEAFPRAVLKHHYPEVPLHGDFTTIQSGTYEPIRLLVGGTPCQDFSIAGLRKGLAGERGNLTLEYLKLAARLRPKWLVWENVPGVLSQDKGRAFGAFLGGLGELGYGFAYRVLDAQHFGVPQRRRRVFVVGYLGDWRRPAAVLFERESLCGNPPPRREAGASVAALTANGVGTCGADDNQAQARHLSANTLVSGGHTNNSLDETLIPARYVPAIMAQAITAKIAKGSSGPAGDEHHNLIAFDTTQITSSENRSTARGDTAGSLAAGAWPTGDKTDALTCNTDPNSHVVAFQECVTGVREYANAGTLRAGGPGHDPVGTRLRLGNSVRRLTPRECERLQGFPDDFTLVPFRNKPASDGPRYKAMGNSMAVNVMRWIGQRIELVDRMDNQFGELG